MFSLSPLVLGIYILSAVLPALLLMGYIYRQDTAEKEPSWLLASLLFFGVLAAICSGAAEQLCEGLLRRLIDPGSPFYTIILAFFVVAITEEGIKLLLLKYRTWRDPNFNYRFDGIVYAVFLSLGFAAYENLQYVLHYGLSVAFLRALLAVPGHLSFAVFMGYFYGRAKAAQLRGWESTQKLGLWMAYLSAVVLHGVYDACAMQGSLTAALLFLIFILALYTLTYRLIRRESRLDSPMG